MHLSSYQDSSSTFQLHIVPTLVLSVNEYGNGRGYTEAREQHSPCVLTCKGAAISKHVCVLSQMMQLVRGEELQVRRLEEAVTVRKARIMLMEWSSMVVVCPALVMGLFGGLMRGEGRGELRVSGSVG